MLFFNIMKSISMQLNTLRLTLNLALLQRQVGRGGV